ncbi:MAG: hypothetical protein V2A56_13260 [bacterium]
MEPKTSKVDEKLLTPQQLCDALEVYLGHEKGRKKCRELLTKLENDPSWKAQLNTLSCTVQVYQKCEGVEVPDEVSYRLKTVLDLADPEAECKDDK